MYDEDNYKSCSDCEEFEELLDDMRDHFKRVIKTLRKRDLLEDDNLFDPLEEMERRIYL